LLAALLTEVYPGHLAKGFYDQLPGFILSDLPGALFF
jgi:hypothetical protein